MKLCLAQGWRPNLCSESLGGEKHLTSPGMVGQLLSLPVPQRLQCQGIDGCLFFPQCFLICFGQ